MGVLASVVPTVVAGALLATLQVTDIPYVVDLSPTAQQRASAIVQDARGRTSAPYNPVISAYRTSGEPIILGDGGTRLYLRPNLSSSILALPPQAIEHAELRLPVRQRAASLNSGSVAFGCYQILDSWAPTSSGFSAPPAAASPFSTASLYYDTLRASDSSGGSSPSQNTVVGPEQTLSCDVTGVVRQWLAGATPYGFMVRETSSSSTRDLWWESRSGTRPEMVLTVRRDYMPSPHARVETRQPALPIGGGANPSGQDQVPLEVGLSMGGAVFAANLSGPEPAIWVQYSGLQGAGALSLNLLEIAIEGKHGNVTREEGTTIPQQFAHGEVDELTLMGSIALPLARNAAFVPGMGMRSSNFSLDFGNHVDGERYTRSFSGILLAGELRWRPVAMVDVGLRLAVTPDANGNEAYRQISGATWTEQAVNGLSTRWSEGRGTISIRLLPQFQVQTGYAIENTYTPAQEGQYWYSDSAGNIVPGKEMVASTATSEHNWYIGAAVSF